MATIFDSAVNMKLPVVRSPWTTEAEWIFIIDWVKSFRAVMAGGERVEEGGRV